MSNKSNNSVIIAITVAICIVLLTIIAAVDAKHEGRAKVMIECIKNNSALDCAKLYNP